MRKGLAFKLIVTKQLIIIISCNLNNYLHQYLLENKLHDIIIKYVWEKPATLVRVEIPQKCNTYLSLIN